MSTTYYGTAEPFCGILEDNDEAPPGKRRFLLDARDKPWPAAVVDVDADMAPELLSLLRGAKLVRTHHGGEERGLVVSLVGGGWLPLCLISERGELAFSADVLKLDRRRT